MRLRRDEAAAADGDNTDWRLLAEIPPDRASDVSWAPFARWMRRNKPQGLESIQRRVACRRALQELDRRIDEYLREPGSAFRTGRCFAPLTNLSGRYQYVWGISYCLTFGLTLRL